MGYLTEPEILDKLIDALRIAAQASDDISIRPKKGRTYRELRDALAEVESACRQMAHWRGQYNWLNLGRTMAEAHRWAGGWLRGVPDTIVDEAGAERKIHRQLSLGEKHPLFVKLAEKLRDCRDKAVDLKNRATGHVGAVLPEVQDLGRRVGAPVPVTLPPGMLRRTSGLIVPQGAAVQ